MEPKQEAERLIKLFYLSNKGCTTGQAKIYAEICVNEKINLLDEISLGESGTTKIDYGQSFQREVKTEIQNYK